MSFRFTTMNKLLRNFILSLLLLAALTAGLRFYRAAHPPYHTVVPITLTARNEIIVTLTVNGVAREMYLNLSSPMLVYAPAGLLYKRYQIFMDGKISKAAIGLGAYARTCKVTQTNAPGARLKNKGVLGSGMFDSSDPKEAARLTFDLRARTLSIDWLPARPVYAPSPHAIALPLHNDREDAEITDWKVDVKLGGQVPARMRLCLDGPTTFISWEAAKKLLKKQDPALLARLSLTGLSPKQIGRMTKEEIEYTSGFHRLQLPVTLGIGNRAWKLSCYTLTNGDTANLGMDVLHEFRIIVDYRDKMVYLEPYK